MPSRTTRSVLFICTGNVFRSLIAEYACKSLLISSSQLLAGSAGIEALPQEVAAFLIELLNQRGIDASHHLQRKLTTQLLLDSDLAVAMNTNHQLYVRKHFQRDIPLFNRVCYGEDTPVLDISEALPNWPDTSPDEIVRYARLVIDHLFDSMPLFLERAGDFMV